jgi:hypothetical protein
MRALLCCDAKVINRRTLFAAHSVNWGKITGTPPDCYRSAFRGCAEISLSGFDPDGSRSDFTLIDRIVDRLCE